MPPRDVDAERVLRSLALIEHHLSVLYHSPEEVEGSVASMRVVIDDLRESLVHDSNVMSTPFTRHTIVPIAMSSSARHAVTSVPYVRKSVYTFTSDRPFSIAKKEPPVRTARRAIIVAPPDAAAL